MTDSVISETTADVPTFWTPGYFRLFISHVSSAKDVAAELKTYLRWFGISAFVAHDDIEPTLEWQDEIERALDTMDALAALLTPGFNESKWTDQEVGIAIGKKCLVMPLRFGLDPYGFIGKHQGLQIAGKTYQQAAEAIFQVLAKNDATKARMTEGAISILLQSSSWGSARSSMSLVEKCGYFNEHLLQRLENAPSINSEIANAFGVPARIETILQKWRQQ